MLHHPEMLLNDGSPIPTIGIGTWMGHGFIPENVINTIRLALKAGYRHIDTAFNYGTEVCVGNAIRMSRIPRKEIFITTKLTGEHHRCVQEGFGQSLRNLGCEYVDLFLMHWPQALTEDGQALQPEQYPTFVDTWKEMERLVETGKVRSIGVSNFSIKNLEVLLPQVSIIPAVNQVEMHPLLPQADLLAYCKAKSILLTAYSPTGKHNDILVKHPSVVSVMNRLHCSAAQVLLSWNVTRGAAVIPKTVTAERIKENLILVDILPEEMTALDSIHQEPGFHRSVCLYHSPGGVCFGWTYEQLGWPMKEGGIVVIKAGVECPRGRRRYCLACRALLRIGVSRFTFTAAGLVL